MKMVNKKAIKRIIEELLNKYEYLRDSDEKLASNVLYKYLLMRSYQPEKLSAFEFLTMYSMNQLPTIDSISRIRRKLQEENEHLRGKFYQGRKKIANDVRKKNIDLHELL